MDLDMLNMLYVLLLLKKDMEQSFYRNLFDKFVKIFENLHNFV